MSLCKVMFKIGPTSRSSKLNRKWKIRMKTILLSKPPVTSRFQKVTDLIYRNDKR